jgi:hypothetical protein
VVELRIPAQRMRNIEYTSRRRDAAIILSREPLIMIAYFAAKMIIHCTGSKE